MAGAQVRGAVICLAFTVGVAIVSVVVARLRRMFDLDADPQAIAAALTAHLFAAQESPEALYKVGLASVRFLLAVGDLLIGWRLQVQAEVAIAALDAGSEDTAFYQGKVAVAQFFARNVLPELTALRGILENVDNEIMEVDEAAF